MIPPIIIYWYMLTKQPMNTSAKFVAGCVLAWVAAISGALGLLFWLVS